MLAFFIHSVCSLWLEKKGKLKAAFSNTVVIYANTALLLIMELGLHTINCQKTPIEVEVLLTFYYPFSGFYAHKVQTCLVCP